MNSREKQQKIPAVLADADHGPTSPRLHHLHGCKKKKGIDSPSQKHNKMQTY
jgi:hypothetical protein